MSVQIWELGDLGLHISEAQISFPKRYDPDPEFCFRKSKMESRSRQDRVSLGLGWGTWHFCSRKDEAFRDYLCYIAEIPIFEWKTVPSELLLFIKINNLYQCVFQIVLLISVRSHWFDESLHTQKKKSGSNLILKAVYLLLHHCGYPTQ